VKKGTFKGIAYSSAKKYACNKGELVLTPENLQINCEGHWERIFSNKEIRLEVFDGNLEIRDVWHRRLLFRLIADDAKEWRKAFQEFESEHFSNFLEKFWKEQMKRPEEWKKLFDINPEALRKISNDIRQEITKFRRKNIKFNLEVSELIGMLKSRKLKAFVVAHNYVTWYEWTKGLLSKIYKAKFGKGPKNDEELIRFLDNYPSLRILNTKEWQIEANQIRNCVAHERFYYDYKTSELVFIVKRREKKIRLREVEFRLTSILHTYFELLRFTKEKVEKGEISPQID
jgi:hypothetical protein